MTFRRLSGLDRSGPPPPQTRRPAAARVDDPQRDRLVRLAVIPVFLVLAFNEPDGTAALPAILFALIACSDYADGIAARVTGPVLPLRGAPRPVRGPPAGRRGVRRRAGTYELLPRWALASSRARAVHARRRRARIAATASSWASTGPGVWAVAGASARRSGPSSAWRTGSRLVTALTPVWRSRWVARRSMAQRAAPLQSATPQVEPHPREVCGAILRSARCSEETWTPFRTLARSPTRS